MTGCEAIRVKYTFHKSWGVKSMHVHRCTASIQVSADAHAQTAAYIRYHGAIVEAHRINSCVHA